MQRAYTKKHSKPALADGVDVIAVGSLAFKRFLEIAVFLELDVRVVTDNDGSMEKLKEKYADYIEGQHPKIKLCYDDDEDYGTLEPQLLKANSCDTLNAILGKQYTNKEELLRYMGSNKTDCALKMFGTDKSWNTPQYILKAIDWESTHHRVRRIRQDKETCLRRTCQP